MPHIFNHFTATIELGISMLKIQTRDIRFIHTKLTTRLKSTILSKIREFH